MNSNYRSITKAPHRLHERAIEAGNGKLNEISNRESSSIRAGTDDDDAKEARDDDDERLQAKWNEVQ